MGRELKDELAAFGDTEITSAPIIALTGDLTEVASGAEFRRAKHFLDQVTNAEVFGSRVAPEDVYVIPGNHDVDFDEQRLAYRWVPYCEFLQNWRGIELSPLNPHRMCRIVDRTTERNLIVAEINSCIHVEKDTKEEKRGRLDDNAVDILYEQLAKVTNNGRQEALKVALIHHHPLLLPAFLNDESYDPVDNGQALLQLLEEFRFHLLLHGHKHNPWIFSYDPVSTWTSVESNPMLIVAGGSIGSTHIATEPREATNTQGIINVKWNPNDHLARVQVITRGLVRENKGVPLARRRWYWKTLRHDERIIKRRLARDFVGRNTPREFEERDRTHDDERVHTYRDLRGNMPIVEVLPSLYPGQEYEARVKLVPHNSGEGRAESPTFVEWSAGEKFKVVGCRPDLNPDFNAVFHYYKPMLIQARLHFDDQKVAYGYVYAHIP